MKKIGLAFAAFLFSLVIACNNQDKKPVESGQDEKAQADSLENEVMEGHNLGMARMSTISKLKQEANRLIDSINKLPAKAKEAAAPYRAKLSSLLDDLDHAQVEMDNWMSGFVYDSARDDLKQRIRYLADEKIKVGKVKETILKSLQEADSLIKTKF